VRTLAWCPRPRNAAASLEGALVATEGRHTFDLSLVTPDGAAFEGEVEMLIVPGQDG
jgi:hypothetical protein